MKFSCNSCSKSFGSKESLDQHVSTKHATLPKAKNSSRTFIISGLVVAIVVVLGMSVYSQTQGSGSLDSFTACLKDKGVVMYGNDFCSFTVQQLNFFGSSKDQVNYVRCTDDEALCDEKEVRVTPTWEFNSQMYPQVQTLKALSAATGCALE